MNPESIPIRDIHAASEAPWWPLAWGWWLLIAALVLVMLVLLVRMVRRWRLHRYRQQVMSEIEGRLARAGDTEYWSEANQCFKRLLVHVGNRKEAASLSGAEWAEVLASPDPEKWGDVARDIAAEAYKSASSTPDREAIIDLLRVWADRSVEAGHA